MDIVRFIPPGKLLTIAHDAGAWYSWAAPQKERFSISTYNANYRFWHTLCSPKFQEVLFSPLTVEQKGRVLRAWESQGINLPDSAVKASAALRGLSAHTSFSSVENYSLVVSGLAEYLIAVNRVQRFINFSVQAPHLVMGLDYSSSEKLAEYALRRDTLLYRLTAASLADFSISSDGVVLLALKSYLELLTGMSAAVVIKDLFPNAHISLAEHRYEYFSLDPHMENIKSSGALLKVFDSVVEQGHGAQELISGMIEKLQGGGIVSGFINKGSFEVCHNPLAARRVPPEYPSAFSPEPLLWTRLSPAGCCWGKCVFCAQGHQGEPGVPVTAFDADVAVQYLADCVSSGYSKFSFSDEEIGAGSLEVFCIKMLERSLDIRWSCRCRCDIGDSPALFRLMYKSGCREILFGLESTSERVLGLMGKYAGPFGTEEAEKLFRSVNEAGIGLHLSFMGGFPGETPVELRNTVEFVRKVLKGIKNSTYVFNQFELLPGSKMFKDPSAFNICVEIPAGDIPLNYRYQAGPEIRKETEETNSLVSSLRDELGSSLGWGDSRSGLAAAIVRYLYFSSGHGLVFKSSENNPFENPLLRVAPGVFGASIRAT